MIIFFLFLFCFQVQDKPQNIINNLEELNAAEGKITLSPVHIWGDDDTEDINQFFRFPSDVKIDSKGNIYIVDSANNRIQVFNSSRKYIRTLGKRGEGPADTLMPGKMAFTQNDDIVFADLFNFRIQVLDPKGKYIGSFRTNETMPVNFALSQKDEVLLYLPQKNGDCKWTVSLYDLKGNPEKKVCTFPCIKGTNSREPLLTSIDDKGNVFISFLRVPFFKRYSIEGKPLMTVFYEPPFLVSPDSTDKDDQPHPFLVDCSIDGQGRIFAVLYNRPRLNMERFYMTGIGERTPKEFPEKTDLFRLVVFNPAGKIIASKVLPVYCDQIHVHGNRLFIIDTYRFMVIHEYTFEL